MVSAFGKKEHLLGWRGYIDPSRETVFFWSQKAACTTLFTLLADNMPERPTSKKHFHTKSNAYPVCLQTLAQGHRSVILVRDPARRAVSAYLNKFCLYRRKRLRTRADLEPFAQDLHDLFRARTGQDGDANIMTFEDFLDTVEALHAARPDPKVPVNGHWDTQIPAFLAVDPGFGYDHVLRVETLDADLKALAETLDLRLSTRRMNSTPVADGPRERRYLGRVPACDVATHAFGHDNFISADTLARIERIYAVDYATFGYRPPRLQGLRDRIRKIRHPAPHPRRAATRSGPTDPCAGGDGTSAQP